MRERAKAIIVRLTDKEKMHLVMQAENAGLKMEPFIRKLITGADIQPRPPEELHEIQRLLGDIYREVKR